MILTVLELLRFGFSLVFGLAVSALFAGIEPTRKNRLSLGLLCAVLFYSGRLLVALGLDLTSKLYPVITHIPLVFIFSLYYKRPWLVSAVRCLPPTFAVKRRAGGFPCGAVSGSSLADHIFYIAAVFLCYYFLKEYVAGSVWQLMEKSIESCLLLGGVPLFYYKKHGAYRRQARRSIPVFSKGWLVYISGHYIVVKI